MNQVTHVSYKIFTGAISAVLYVKEKDFTRNSNEMSDWLAKIHRSNILIHFVFERGVSADI